MERRFVFLGWETQKMINCQHLIVQRWFRYPFQYYFSKLYPISLTKITEITYSIYEGFSKKQILQGIFQKKSHQRTRGLILSLRVLPPFTPG